MVSISNRTRYNPPRIPVEDLLHAIHSPRYELSVVFVGEKKIRELNKHYRQKDKATDVLSFTLDKHSGEIFICPRYIRNHLWKYEYTKTIDVFRFLFIHALLHLKGMDHGSTMENEEKKWMKHFFG